MTHVWGGVLGEGTCPRHPYVLCTHKNCHHVEVTLKR